MKGSPSGIERARLEAVTRSGAITEDHLAILRWLAWIALLSHKELTALLQVPASTLWDRLSLLKTEGLIETVVVKEPGRADHLRYYVSDLGLYTLCALHTPPLSVRKIAMSYPVTELDLATKLARSHTLCLLSALVRGLVAGRPTGWLLASYQSPYQERYRSTDGRGHRLQVDAAFLLKAAGGEHHGFYLVVDDPEGLLSRIHTRALLRQVMELRQSMLLQQERCPHLLILSAMHRFAFWAEELTQVVLKGGHSLPSGAIADAARLAEGVYHSIWLPFAALLEQREHAASGYAGLSAFTTQPASPRLVEHLSQAFSFARAILTQPDSTHARRGKRLPAYVGTPLGAQASDLITTLAPDTPYARGGYQPLMATLITLLRGDPHERHVICCLLSLALTGRQKMILCCLLRHPYLGEADLCALLDLKEERLLQRHLRPLVRLEFVGITHWNEERYFVREAALRYLAMRHQVKRDAYLEPLLPGWRRPTAAVRRTISPSDPRVIWVQRWVQLLRRQRSHTCGLYRCVRHLLLHAGNTYRVLCWYSAREAFGWCAGQSSNMLAVDIRPDAALLIACPSWPAPRMLLVEYDRATAGERNYQRKFRAYATFQQLTGKTLPPILFITQQPEDETAIWQARTAASAFEVQIITTLEAQVIAQGLSAVFEALR